MTECIGMVFVLSVGFHLWVYSYKVGLIIDKRDFVVILYAVHVHLFQVQTGIFLRGLFRLSLVIKHCLCFIVFVSYGTVYVWKGKYKTLGSLH